jgi:putative modified peptide
VEDIILPNPYALVLLRKLAADTDFRKVYECNPVQALRDIGVPEDILRKLPPGHQAPIKLADMHTFQEALYQLIDEVASVCVCHAPPQVKLSVGSPTKTTPRTSFGAS